MKKLAITLICIATLSSCSFFNSETNIENKEGSKKVREVMIEKFGGDTKIQRVTLISQQELNTTIDLIQATESGKEEETMFYSYIKTYDKLTNEKQQNFNKNNVGICIKDIPEDLFYNNVQKILPLVSKELEFNSVKSYSQEFENNKPGKSEIIVHATPNKSSTTLKGRKLETTYYELIFEIDDSGNVKMKEE